MTIEQIIDWKKAGATVFWNWNSYSDEEIEGFKKRLDAGDFTRDELDIDECFDARVNSYRTMIIKSKLKHLSKEVYETLAEVQKVTHDVSYFIVPLEHKDAIEALDLI